MKQQNSKQWLTQFIAIIAITFGFNALGYSQDDKPFAEAEYLAMDELKKLVDSPSFLVTESGGKREIKLKGNSYTKCLEGASLQENKKLTSLSNNKLTLVVSMPGCQKEINQETESVSAETPSSEVFNTPISLTAEIDKDYSGHVHLCALSRGGKDDNDDLKERITGCEKLTLKTAVDVSEDILNDGGELVSAEKLKEEKEASKAKAKKKRKLSKTNTEIETLLSNFNQECNDLKFSSAFSTLSEIDSALDGLNLSINTGDIKSDILSDLKDIISHKINSEDIDSIDDLESYYKTIEEEILSLVLDKDEKNEIKLMFRDRAIELTQGFIEDIDYKKSSSKLDKAIKKMKNFGRKLALSRDEKEELNDEIFDLYKEAINIASNEKDLKGAEFLLDRAAKTVSSKGNKLRIAEARTNIYQSLYNKCLRDAKRKKTWNARKCDTYHTKLQDAWDTKIDIAESADLEEGELQELEDARYALFEQKYQHSYTTSAGYPVQKTFSGSLKAMEWSIYIEYMMQQNQQNSQYGSSDIFSPAAYNRLSLPSTRSMIINPRGPAASTNLMRPLR